MKDCTVEEGSVARVVDIRGKGDETDGKAVVVCWLLGVITFVVGVILD